MTFIVSISDRDGMDHSKRDHGSIGTGDVFMAPDSELTCPNCGRAETLACTDDLGEEGKFYSCHPGSCGCGTTFRLHPSGDIFDIF